MQSIKIIIAATLICGVSACTFFDEPLDDLTTITQPAPEDTTTERLPPPPPPVKLPTLDSQQAVASSADGTYLTVSSIFDVPEDASNLAFVHFTDRDKRREAELCKSLLDTYPVTAPAQVPANAATVIVWPIVEGSTPDNCSAMVKSHEPLDISSATAEIVQSSAKGPFMLTRNSAQQKQLIYDFSSVGSSDLSGALNEWRGVLGGDPQSWPPVIKAQ